MSAIAGYWSSADPGKSSACCRRLLEAQGIYGPDDVAMTMRGGYAAGRCLFRTVPEDGFDRQPLSAPDGRFLLVADIRLDNREELLATLGMPQTEGLKLADADILLIAWRRWEEEALGRILGDYAFALWDDRNRKLVLARDPLGERPLHYRSGAGYLAFASMPQPLAGLGGARAADEARIARFVADFPPAGPRSFFAQVDRVEPGHLLVARAQGVRARRFWRPSFASLRSPAEADYGEGLREQLDAAVRRRLRRVRGTVGAHLSSGYDSSAVATSAAVQLHAAGEPLFAFTSAPPIGFKADFPGGRIADESGIAAATAALHANIEHVVLRPPFGSALHRLSEANRFAGQPTGHVLNGAWWAAINAAAQERQVSVMLTGEAGNFTLSAGLGLDELPDLMRQGAPAYWWREARSLAAGQYRWRNVLNASLRPWLPPRLYDTLRRGGARSSADPAFLSEPWRSRLGGRRAELAWERLLGLSGKERRWAMLGLVDPGNFRKYSLAQWGVEERDATADRRLVEYCFSLPVEARLNQGVLKPALRRALAGRVAPAVLNPSGRGYQSSDWRERVSREEAAAFAAALGAGDARGVIDFDAVRAVAERWPAAGSATRSDALLYSMKLLRTLAAASFMADVREAGHG